MELDSGRRARAGERWQRPTLPEEEWVTDQNAMRVFSNGIQTGVALFAHNPFRSSSLPYGSFVDHLILIGDNRVRVRLGSMKIRGPTAVAMATVAHHRRM